MICCAGLLTNQNQFNFNILQYFEQVAEFIRFQYSDRFTSYIMFLHLIIAVIVIMNGLKALKH